MNTTKDPSTRKRKVAAIAAGALVIGVGAAYTLATWNDSEWVFGEATTSSFNVEQNVDPDFAPGFEDVNWTDNQENPGGQVTFTAGFNQLVPNSPIAAGAALRTAAASEGGVIDLLGAEPAEGVAAVDDESALWDAMKVSIFTQTADPEDSAPDCTTTPDETWTAILTDGALDDPATGGGQQSLVEKSGSIQYYCFVLTLHDTDIALEDLQDLQALTIAPAWNFEAESTGYTP